MDGRAARGLIGPAASPVSPFAKDTTSTEQYRRPRCSGARCPMCPRLPGHGRRPGVPAGTEASGRPSLTRRLPDVYRAAEAGCAATLAAAYSNRARGLQHATEATRVNSNFSWIT